MGKANQLGQEAAHLKWEVGLTWPEIFDRFPQHKPNKVRSAARRWKKTNIDKAEAPRFHADLGIQFTEQDNRAEAKSVTTQIKTLEQLLVVCNVDLDIWEVRDWNVKTYDGWRGDTQKDLVFEQGRITGYVKDGGLVTKTLYSVNATLVKLKPTQLRPTFQPIVVAASLPKPQHNSRKTSRQDLVVSDTHIGFRRDIQTAQLEPLHDRLAIDIIIQIARDLQPDNIVILGDLLDLAEWTSHYVRRPEFYWTTQPAILETFWILSALRINCPDSKITLLEGNHDIRLPKYVYANVMEAHGLTAIDGLFPVLTLPNLLGLDSLHIDWIGGYDDGTSVYSPQPWLKYLHGSIIRGPGATAKAMVEQAIQWKIFGHTHRCEIASKSYDTLAPVSAVSFGCCCHTDGRVPGSTPESQWQKRFGVICYEDRQPESVNLEIISVESGIASWRGSVYTGKNYVSNLKEKWSDWNW